REVAGSAYTEGGRRVPRAALAAVAATLAVATASAFIVTRWNSVEVATAPAVPVAAVAAPAPPSPPVPPPSHAALKSLLDEGLGADADAAYATIASRWGASYARRGSEPPCRAVRRAALECIPRRGTWSLVRQFDLPAVLEIVGANGVTHFIALT